MRKLAIISTAAFYLLLTTGMFVCIVHCAGEYFIQPKLAMYDDHDADHDDDHHGEDKHHKDKDCGEGKDCSCCNKHGNYIVKENSASGLDFKAPQITIITHYQPFLNAFTRNPLISQIFWHEGNAPPGTSGKSIIIKFRTFLI